MERDSQAPPESDLEAQQDRLEAEEGEADIFQRFLESDFEDEDEDSVSEDAEYDDAFVYRAFRHPRVPQFERESSEEEEDDSASTDTEGKTESGDEEVMGASNSGNRSGGGNGVGNDGMEVDGERASAASGEGDRYREAGGMMAETSRDRIGRGREVEPEISGGDMDDHDSSSNNDSEGADSQGIYRLRSSRVSPGITSPSHRQQQQQPQHRHASSLAYPSSATHSSASSSSFSSSSSSLSSSARARSATVPVTQPTRGRRATFVTRHSLPRHPITVVRPDSVKSGRDSRVVYPCDVDGGRTDWQGARREISRGERRIEREYQTFV